MPAGNLDQASIAAQVVRIEEMICSRPFTTEFLRSLDGSEISRSDAPRCFLAGIENKEMDGMSRRTAVEESLCRTSPVSEPATLLDR